MICSKCGVQNEAGAQICRQCGSALQNLEQPVSAQSVAPNINQNTSGGNYRLTLTRPKSYVGSLIKFKIFLDNNMVGTIKNGETVVLNVPSGNHIISFNKTMDQNITISGDTFADVIVVAGNKFGLTNIRDNNGTMTQNNTLTTDNIDRVEKSATSPLIFSAVCILLTFVLLFTINMVVSPWIYGISIGYTVINMSSLKKMSQIPSERQKKIKSLNTTAIIVSIIGAIISIALMI